jgi:hypothetical protein
MQFGGGGIPPVGVLFDGAFDRIGDLLALAVLYGLDGKSEMRVTAISVSRPDFPAAQFCDLVKRFYSGASFGGGGFGGGGFSLPVAMADGKPQPLPVYAKLFANTSDDGAAVYKAATALRNALTASQPHNSILIASGSLVSVARLLDLRGSKLLIEDTVRHLVIADSKISGDTERATAEKLLAEWPTPIYVCGADIGDAIRYPAASIEKDFAGPKANPIADAYRAFGDMPYDAPTTAADAALFAVRTTANYFKLSEPGTFHVSAAGAIEHTPSVNGKHRRMLYDETQKDNVVKALTELASAPPRPPGPGRRGGKADPNANQPPVKKQ